MDNVSNLIMEYLKIFPTEKERQNKLIEFISENKDIIDWNNFNGHLVAGGLIYAKKEQKFLMLFHKDLKMFLSPGGHIDEKDVNIVDAAKREIFEETGLANFEQIKICDNELIPIDIDTHIVGYNERLNLPEHYHFEFRYLFQVNEISNIKIDFEESESFKWVDMNQIKKDKNYETILQKIEKIV